ncbi:hypothetical protein ABZ904_17905 [Streptomyces sp. NPDC046900]|uniref:hypothetical protein n=1 Tax=Streptomyces sp. NPDC046900 TaxID=3155473 RepID=UPI0033E69AD3
MAVVIQGGSGNLGEDVQPVFDPAPVACRDTLFGVCHLHPHAQDFTGELTCGLHYSVGPGDCDCRAALAEIALKRFVLTQVRISIPLPMQGVHDVLASRDELGVRLRAGLTPLLEALEAALTRGL